MQCGIEEVFVVRSLKKIFLATGGPAAHSGHTDRGLRERQQGGILPGKPWEDHTLGCPSPSSMQTEGKSVLAVPSPWLKAVRKRKDSFSPPPPASQVTRKPLVLQNHTHSCLTSLHVGPQSLLPLAQSKEQETDHPFPGVAAMNRIQGHKGAQGWLQEPPQVISTQLPHTSSCSGLGTLAKPQPLVQNYLSTHGHTVAPVSPASPQVLGDPVWCFDT